MTDNLYAPPQADMSKTPVAAGSDDSFYVVSQRKFTLMFILTFTLYLYYWFYKNWANYKKQCQLQNAADSDIWPVPRAIFAIFFIHSLFRNVDQHAEAKQRPLGWNVGAHATWLVVMLVITNLANGVITTIFGQVLGSLVTIGLLAGICYSLRSAQAYINKSCGDPEGARNNRLTTANYVWMAAGIILWLLIIFSAASTGVSA
ncbi:hypothetical protein HF313_11980 [Massilia atriviolacea]|uniref:DUF4234 domain-containing protein n=1 Tax=Massilia atriviolacea TaxID=2495579 RepID=A0A430HIU3_9BURK|nr:hypothetical protein [Massilia atriviolacea]RSZ57447.1 hypothetical protein EJB06_20105 [Massilia atriviolacea]